MRIAHVLVAAIALFRVVIAPPRYSVLLPDRASELRTICGSDTRGCTHIRGSVLHADCVGEGEHWHAALDVSFVPYVYIGDWGLRHAIAAHEREHLLDLRDAAERFARDNSQFDYGSRERCTGDAGRLAVVLEGTLERAAAASMELRR